MTVRDVRQKWPEAEKSLAAEGEIIITRDGKPVARLLPVEPVTDTRPRFDPEEHHRMMMELWGGQMSGIDSLALLQADRDDRNLL